jgi:hypothetical protein
LLRDGIEITPGPESYHSPDPARIVLREGKIDSITVAAAALRLRTRTQLVTALFDAEQRSSVNW